MSLDLAIKQMEEALSVQGTRDQPAEGTISWFTLRAASVGLSFLRSAKEHGITSPAELEKYFRSATEAVKIASIH